MPNKHFYVFGTCSWLLQFSQLHWTFFDFSCLANLVKKKKVLTVLTIIYFLLFRDNLYLNLEPKYYMCFPHKHFIIRDQVGLGS